MRTKTRRRRKKSTEEEKDDKVVQEDTKTEEKEKKKSCSPLPSHQHRSMLCRHTVRSHRDGKLGARPDILCAGVHHLVFCFDWTL